MTNIWGFLIQTLSVTLIAGMFLLIKTLLNDKLSPRWQYGVWSIIAVRILLPVSMRKSLLLPIPVWIETLKGFVEKRLVSNYSEVYIPARIKHIFPIVEGKPMSITDWLFVVYAIGILVSLAWYLISYLRLRILLNKGSELTVELQDKINLICEKYGLKACKAVMIKGLPSAFVCGGIKPILALPADKNMDEKVILHELLHLKYHDELQSLAWCVLRCLHWCNPFLQYVFNRIENDMESLCDQRVLERLQGEERREYGVILLEMANEKYARVPGTSSISNGGKNISRRIAAIVRFKKYPKGMALVSVCIILVLFPPALSGTAYAYRTNNYKPIELERVNSAMAMARVNRCRTIAGALDTYAKGLMLENGIYIASASSLEKQESIAKKLEANEGVTHLYWYDAGSEFENVERHTEYMVWNLQEIQKDYYMAQLMFSVYSIETGTSESLIIPVAVKYEDAWVVEECGNRMKTPAKFNEAWSPEIMITGLRQYTGTGETGTVTITLHTAHYVSNTVENSFSPFGSSFDENINLDAEFTKVQLFDSASYEYTENSEGTIPKASYGIHFVGVKSPKDAGEFSDIVVSANESGTSGNEEIWFGELVGNGRLARNSGWHTFESYELKKWENCVPEYYKVRVFWDGEIVEELTLSEAENIEADFVVTGQISQRAVSIREELMLDFVEEKRITKKKEYEVISPNDIYDRIEELTFTDNDAGKTKLLSALEEGGVFQFERTGSSYIISSYASDVTIQKPELYYNANDGSWIVVCAGYCRENFEDEIITGDIGTRDSWGFDFLNTDGPYAEGSYVMDARASLSDEDNSRREETSSRSDFTPAGRQGFELQDYTYKDIPVTGKTKYVGARWFGACTFAPGFENCTADLVVYYNHTN